MRRILVQIFSVSEISTFKGFSVVSGQADQQIAGPPTFFNKSHELTKLSIEELDGLVVLISVMAYKGL